MRLTERAGVTGRRWRDDQGLTLIELLIAIVIMGIIIAPLANGLISFFRDYNDTNRRLSESHDAQITAAYFAQDVSSIGVHDWADPNFAKKPSVEVNVGPMTGLSWCGPAGTPNAVIRMAWDNPTTAAGPPEVIRVSYVVKTVSGGGKELHRLECSGPAQNPTLLSDIVLAHNVDSVDAPQCTPAPATCTPPFTPETVTLVLHLRAAGSTGPIFTVTLTGQRRQS